VTGCLLQASEFSQRESANFPGLTSLHLAATMKGMSGAFHLQLGKFLVVGGIALVVLGLMVMAGAKFPSLGLGRLPGDITYKGKHFQLYFPIATCVVVSVIATIVLWVISLLTRR
jgi:hypothetical protein